jgi:intracellular multiplication protein IcmE
MALAVALILSGSHQAQVSFDAHMRPVDALPGGLHSTPEQDALARRAETAAAQAAQAHGTSYMPPIAGSTALRATAPRAEEATPPGTARAQAAPPPQPHFIGKPPRVYPPAVLSAQVMRAVAASAPPPPPLERVAQQSSGMNDQQQQFNDQVRGLFNQWDARPPRTDVVLDPAELDRSNPVGRDERAPDTPGMSRGRPGPQTVSTRSDADEGEVLIPAGRGIYAHPVLALSSDQESPAIFQADSGPIAGDRMLGSFAKENKRLVIRVTSVIHQGKPIGVSAVVIAPDTMEASVASGVDEHYAARFALPAAAAFVQGLGQALATTSNTTAVLSALGGATTTTHLNFDQQLGVAAGVAAANIGSTLNAAAPKGPTVTLDANVAVGVMFLTDVIYRPRG